MNKIPQDRHHGHHDRHPVEETRALRARLRKVIGQLNAVEDMLEAERDCAEVLMQLVSARKGLKSLAEKIIQSHLRHCIEEAAEDQVAKRRLRELTQVLERYVE